jgi:hypothetical protein
MWATVAVMLLGSIGRNAEEVVCRISADTVDIEVLEEVAHGDHFQ